MMTDEQLRFLRTAVAQIPPLPPGRERPFWSVVIPAYGRPAHLAQALTCVLDQDPGPAEMSIDVVDDASPTNDIRDLVSRIGGSRVRYFRQPVNLGTYGNVNDALCRAEGRWIHVLNDDDYVEQGFYAQLRASLPEDERIGAALSAITVLVERTRTAILWTLRRNDPGILENWLETVATEGVIQTPAVVVRREVYETLGGYHLGHPWPADWEMWQRIAAHYDWWYEPRTRAFYREHQASFSGAAKRSGSNIADVARAIDFAQNYLPADRAMDLQVKAKRFWVRFAYATARNMVERGEAAGACMQLSEMLRLAPGPTVLKAVLTMQQDLERRRRA